MARRFQLADNISPVQAVSLEIVANANRHGVISGGDITWGNNLSVEFAEGQLLVDGVEVDFDGGTENITTYRPSGTQQRWVLIYASASGALDSVAGVGEANAPTASPPTFPKLPAVPTDAIPLAAVRLHSSDTNLITVAASARALDYRVPAPTVRGITGTDLNENGFRRASDYTPTTAWADLGSFTLELTDTTDLVLLRLALWLTVPNTSGRTLDYRVVREVGGVDTEVLPEASVPYAETREGGPSVYFPYLDEPGTTNEITYKLQVKRSGTGTFRVKEGSYNYGREVHV